MTRHLLAALACAALLAKPAQAQTTDWLADDANVLSESERQQVRDAIDEAFQATSTRICVRTIAAASGVDPKAIAVANLNEWGPGPRSVMLLVCLDPRRIYIQPGTQLKFTFDEGTASAICRDTIAPQLKESRHCEGLLAGIQAIRARVTAGPSPTSTFQTGSSRPWAVYAVVAFLILFCGLFGRRGGSGYYASDSSWSFGGDSGGGGGSCDGGGGGGSSF